MGSFVDRVEQGVIQRRQAIMKEHESRIKAAQDAVPQAVYDLPVFTLGLADTVNEVIQEQEYENIGDLMVQYFFDPSKLLEIEGLDEKILEDLHEAFEVLTSSLPEPEPVVEEVEEEPIEVDAAIEQEEEAAAEIIETDTELEPEAVTEIVQEEQVEDADAAEAIEEKPGKEEDPASLEEIFQLKPEMLDIPEVGEDEDPEVKKKKKKKYVDVEYDPDQDVTIFRKKRKRESEGWSEWDDNSEE
jgi:preprotein translocase subunit SecD